MVSQTQDEWMILTFSAGLQLQYLKDNIIEMTVAAAVTQSETTVYGHSGGGGADSQLTVSL